MTELTAEFHLSVPAEDAHWACREAAMYLDWPLLETIEPRRLVLKKGLRFGTGSLTRLEVLLSEDAPDATTVALQLKYPGGVGPIDERTSQSMVNGVRNAIEVIARRMSRPALPPAGLRAASA